VVLHGPGSWGTHVRQPPKVRRPFGEKWTCRTTKAKAIRKRVAGRSGRCGVGT
jgi:hypothetical protein